MPSLDLIQLHFDHPKLLPSIIPTIAKLTHLAIKTRKINHDLNYFFNSDRNQFDAAKMLHKFEGIYRNEKTVIYTSVDLFIPILTFVFGLGKLGGNIAIISSHRLNTTYYGLPPDEKILAERLVKETIHELGHLFYLRHCNNYRCVMASSNSADELDIKGSSYCQKCLPKIEAIFKGI